MKKVYLALALIILVLLARLLSSDGGLGEFFALKEQLKVLESSLDEQHILNETLAKQVKELQNDHVLLETIARQTLGMVKKDEVFVKVIELKRPALTLEKEAESVVEEATSTQIE